MRLKGLPLELNAYPTRSRTNAQFHGVDLTAMDRCFLPPSMACLTDVPPVGPASFIEDDNRGAISSDPVLTLDGVEFFLSVKGVGSTVDPFSFRLLDRTYAAQLTDNPDVRERLLRPSESPPDRMITGELWLRGSPYGGQGLLHAETALKTSERATPTSIGGFLIAPVVKICDLPADLEERVRSIHWYRKFRGPIVQELRLVPSNVRIFFHSRNTIGNNVAFVFDSFAIDSNAKAIQFETHFIRSTVAMLTLFARTLTCDAARRRFAGLDFHDVWLDKDAVLAPNGSVYFVDLEGIDEVALSKDEVKEKLEDQVYRSLYEFMFAYEQVEQERVRRFGSEGNRKSHFEGVVTEALKEDPMVGVVEQGRSLELLIRNRCFEESLYTKFPLVDR